MKRRIWIVIAIVLVAGAAVAPLAWRAHVRGQIVKASVPPRPDLGQFPNELRDRVVAAEAKAKGGDVAALAELQTLYQANGFYPEADACGQALMRVEPGNAKWPHRLATIRAGYGELDTAIQLWERAVRLAPDYLPAGIRLGDAYLKSNHDAEAKRAYEAVLARDSGNPYAQVGLARIDLKAGKPADARDRLEKAAQNSKAAIGTDLLVTVYEELGDKEKAAEMRGRTKSSGTYYDPPDQWIDELMDDCYDSFRIAVAAGMADHRGDPATGRRMLERATQLSPNDAHILLQLGMLCRATGDNDAAQRYLERAAVVDPKTSDAWAQLTDLYATLGNREASARALALGLANCPNSPGLHLERGRRMAAAGQTDAAVAEFRETFRLRPEEAEPLIEIAKIDLQQNRNEEAMAELRHGLEVEPEHPIALMTLAMYSISTGDEKAAHNWVRQCHLQYRVPREALAQIDAQYAQRFGHPFADDQSPLATQR